MRQSRERREQILIALAEGEADVDVLAERFGVSPSTVRRDLQRLSKEKAVMRTYGGAILAPSGVEETLAEREVRNIEAKQAIARAAATHIQDEETVILDGGSTVTALAQLLRERTLRVITNNMKVAWLLADAPGISLILLGGTIRPISMTSYGPLAEEAMRTLTAARLFTSADGVVADRGLCEATLEQASLKRLMMRQAAETLILADSTKLGAASQSAWAPFPARWHLITDRHALDETTAPFASAGGKVTRA